MRRKKSILTVDSYMPFLKIARITLLHIDTSNLNQEQGFVACEKKSHSLILFPIFEDKSMLYGGASCMEEFEILCKYDEIVLGFHEKTNNYSIVSARNHLLQEH